MKLPAERQTGRTTAMTSSPTAKSGEKPKLSKERLKELYPEFPDSMIELMMEDEE